MTRSLLPAFFGDNNNLHSRFQSFQDEVDRLFNDYRGRLADPLSGNGFGANGLIVPRIDVSETDTLVHVAAELPGIKEENIDVTVTGNMLVIKGETSDEHEEKNKNYHLVERAHGSYMRSIPLGFEVDGDQIEANMADGVLNVTITKPAEIAKKTRKIPISKRA